MPRRPGAPRFAVALVVYQKIRIGGGSELVADRQHERAAGAGVDVPRVEILPVVEVPLVEEVVHREGEGESVKPFPRRHHPNELRQTGGVTRPA